MKTEIYNAGVITLLAAAAAPQTDLAFVARYYKQGKAKSTYRLYLARHDGKGLRLAPGVPAGVMTVSWLDHNTLAYLHEEKDGKCGIFTYNLASDATKRIAYTKAFSYFLRDKNGKDFLDSDGKAIRVTLDKVTEFLYPQEVDFAQPIKESDYDGPMVGTTTLGNGQKLSLTYQREMEEDGDFEFSVTGGTQERKFKIKGIRIESVYPETDSALVVTSVPFHKVLRTSRLYRLNMSKGVAKLLVDEVGDLDFHPSSPWYSGAQTEGMPLMKLKDGRMVYTNWLYTGNWKTGERWTVATGLVDVSRAVFRP